MVMQVANTLKNLLGHFVFVGGAVTDLLIENNIDGNRPTKDVDIITEISSYTDQAEFERLLREQGFEAVMDGPVCRWQIGENIVDFMPLAKNVLGFSNPWYPDAVKYAVTHTLPNDIAIRLISAPYFLATKTCAFLDRGNGDFFLNSDIEDMVRVINGRPEIVEEILSSNADVRHYLETHWKAFLNNSDFRESIQWIWNDPASQSRYPLIIERIKAFCEA